jgi:SAM-dependent methyltransferase
MSHAAHSPHHSHPKASGHGPAPEHHAELEEILELDATLGSQVLSQAMDAAFRALDAEPRVIVDLGAGTGTGTVALARRFGDARIHSIDASAGMLDRLRSAAAAAGVTERVDAHPVDLDRDWPVAVPPQVDIVWAALSLHHVVDPVRVLGQAFDALRPGGVLVVIEMTGATHYEPADLGSGRAGLADRMVAALAARGYPVTADWTDALVSAGFAPVIRSTTRVTASAMTTEGARYLELQLALNRPMLADELTDDDLAALDVVVTDLAAAQSRIGYSSGRVIWAASRPASAE